MRLSTFPLPSSDFSRYLHINAAFIKAQINNDPDLHNKPVEFTHTFTESFAQAQVQFAISVVGLEVQARGKLDFRVQPRPSVGADKFRFLVNLNDQNNGWRSISFYYFATQSDQFLAQVLTVRDFSAGLDNTKFAVFRPITRFTDFQNSPVIKAYISGFSIKAKPLDSQFDKLNSQYQAFKKMSTNQKLKSSFAAAVQSKKSLNLRLLDVKQVGRFYSFSIQTTSNLLSLTYSIIIFSKVSVQNQHNFITGDFTLVNNQQKTFTSLQNMDMIFTGITNIKLARDQFYGFSLRYANLGGQSMYEYDSSHPYFDFGFTYFAIQIKYSLVCKDCNKSPYIYNDRFCVSQCPKGFSVAEVAGAQVCDQCNIDKLKVIDPQSNLCVCAKRHYLDIAADTCKPCRYDCMTCNAPDACLTCDNALLQTKRKLNNSGKCLCPSTGFYDDKNAENIVCQKCSSKCLTCNGPRAFDCLTCQSSKELDANRFCVCKNGFVEDQAGNCICPPPRILNGNGTCTNPSGRCEANQQQKTINGVKKCVCKSGFIAVLDDCIKCGKNSVFNKDQMKCECLKPTVQVNGSCLNCKQNQVYDEVYKVCVCSNGAYKKNDGSCTTCPPKMVLIDDICQCIFNFYDPGNGVCKPCKSQNDGPKCKRNVY